MDCEGRRIHYHVTYDDGDEEDFDYEEMKCAVELQQAVALGTYQSVEETQHSGMTFEDDDVSSDESYNGESSNALSIMGAHKNRNQPLAKKERWSSLPQNYRRQLLKEKENKN